MNAPARTYRGTPLHSIRLEHDIWTRVTDAATARGTTASDVIRTAIDAHIPPTKDADA